MLDSLCSHSCIVPFYYYNKEKILLSGRLSLYLRYFSKKNFNALKFLSDRGCEINNSIKWVDEKGVNLMAHRNVPGISNLLCIRYYLEAFVASVRQQPEPLVVAVAEQTVVVTCREEAVAVGPSVGEALQEPCEP